MLALYEQWLLLLSVPIYTVVIVAEILFSHMHHHNYYTWKDTIQNVYLMILNSVLDFSTRIISITVLSFFFKLEVFQWQQKNFLYWSTLVIGLDFLYYWLHRFDHTMRLFWATHVTHHSSPVFNLTVGFRSSVFQPLYRFIYFIPLALFGFHPLDIALVYAATQIWGILVHTNYIKTLGWFEYILVTPSHHRVHHASNILYLDRNMGMFLIIWDRLFGTFQEELDASEYEPIQYGLTKPLEKETPAYVVFHEWNALWKILVSSLPINIKWKYLVNPPGWSHDGSSRTSEQLRQQIVQQTAPENQEDGIFQRVENNAFT